MADFKSLSVDFLLGECRPDTFMGVKMLLNRYFTPAFYQLIRAASLCEGDHIRLTLQKVSAQITQAELRPVCRPIPDLPGGGEEPNKVFEPTPAVLRAMVAWHMLG